MSQSSCRTKFVQCVLLLAATWSSAQQLAADECTCSTIAATFPQCDCSRVWMQTDYLLWWTRGAQVPALVTTSPAGCGCILPSIDDAGVLGVDGTDVLFGGGSLNDSVRSGVRVRGGLWLDCRESCGVDFHFLGLESVGQYFRQTSNGDPILARPLIDANTSQPAAELAAFPGTIRGTIAASVRSQGLYGWGANVRRNIAESSSCCDGQDRLDFVLGYRTTNLSDDVRIREQLTSPLFAAGSQFVREDTFSTRNIFHGANVGLQFERRKEFLRLNAFANVALGSTNSRVAIDGRTRVAAPRTPTFDQDGGLFALTSNMGQSSSSEFTALFDLGFDAGLRVHQQFEIHAGYTFLFWPDVRRAGDQIDTTVNANLLPPPVPGAGVPVRPARRDKSTNFWAQGISFGFEYRY